MITSQFWGVVIGILIFLVFIELLAPLCGRKPAPEPYQWWGYVKRIVSIILSRNELLAVRFSSSHFETQNSTMWPSWIVKVSILNLAEETLFWMMNQFWNEKFCLTTLFWFKLCAKTFFKSKNFVCFFVKLKIYVEERSKFKYSTVS